MSLYTIVKISTISNSIIVRSAQFSLSVSHILSTQILCYVCCYCGNIFTFIIFVHPGGETLSFSYSKNARNPNESSGYSSGSPSDEQPNESSGYSSGSPSDEQPYSSEEQPDTPPTLAGCTCGNCRLYTLCKGGFLLSPDDANRAPLPIQNGMGVGNEDIEHTFGTLVLETCRSFKRKEVSIDEIVLLLEQLPIFDNSTEVIHKAEKMEKLFQSFRNKWSWYNHSLLEDLINDFGDDQDKERFREYHSKFTSFLKNPLPKSQNEYSFGTSCTKGQKLLRIKVNENWDITTLEQVSQIHHSVARILKVQLRDLYLTSVSKGCICLEFLVPESTAIALRTSQEEALMAVGVFRLECGECVFQVYYLTKLSTRNFTDCMLYPSVNFCISCLQLHLPIFLRYRSATLGS